MDPLLHEATYFGFRASRKQPTGRYPYGYGRAEDLAGIVILLAIWTSAGLAGGTPWAHVLRPTWHRNELLYSSRRPEMTPGYEDDRLYARQASRLF